MTEELKPDCILAGLEHRWTKWHPNENDDMDEERHCQRCGIREERTVLKDA